MIHSVIFIPGLGDTSPNGALQCQVIKLWRVWGVRPYCFTMDWSGQASFDTRFKSLLMLIDERLEAGAVSLVGASAGATAVLNAYAARPACSGVVCIAGKINKPETLSGTYRQKQPLFWESAHRTPKALRALNSKQRQSILSIRAYRDELIPASESTVSGAVNRQTKTVGHVITIAVQMVIGAPFFLRFLKTRANQP